MQLVICVSYAIRNVVGLCYNMQEWILRIREADGSKRLSWWFTKRVFWGFLAFYRKFTETGVKS